jgi:hypothetical protein
MQAKSAWMPLVAAVSQRRLPPRRRLKCARNIAARGPIATLRPATKGLKFPYVFQLRACERGTVPLRSGNAKGALSDA